MPLCKPRCNVRVRVRASSIARSGLAQRPVPDNVKEGNPGIAQGVGVRQTSSYCFDKPAIEVRSCVGGVRDGAGGGRFTLRSRIPQRGALRSSSRGNSPTVIK